MVTSFFQRRLGWLLLAVLCAYVLLFKGSHLISPRLGLSPRHETFVLLLFLIITAAGLTLHWGPMIFWPTVGAFAGAQIVVYQLTGLQNIVLFTVVGVLFAFGIETLLQKTN